MKRPVAIFLITSAIALIALFTKPTNEQCLREAKNQYQNRVLLNLSPVSSAVNEPLLKQTLLKAFEQEIFVEDKIVYKAIYQKRGNTKINIGWGGFGKVSINLK